MKTSEKANMLMILISLIMLIGSELVEDAVCQCDNGYTGPCVFCLVYTDELAEHTKSRLLAHTLCSLHNFQTKYSPSTVFSQSVVSHT